MQQARLQSDLRDHRPVGPGLGRAVIGALAKVPEGGAKSLWVEMHRRSRSHTAQADAAGQTRKNNRGENGD